LGEAYTEIFCGQRLRRAYSCCHQSATAIDSAAQSVPGGVGSRGASLFPPPQQTAEEKIASTNYKQAIAEQTAKLVMTKLH
jgi:hypothetical protein